jgi:hypothetical protein
MSEEQKLVELGVIPGVGVDDINEIIREVWQEMQTSQELREWAARDANIPADRLLSSETPFVARTPAESQFGVGTTILIFVGLRVAETFIDRSAGKVFDVFEQIYWPRIRAALGNKVKRK